MNGKRLARTLRITHHFDLNHKKSPQKHNIIVPLRGFHYPIFERKYALMNGSTSPSITALTLPVSSLVR